MKCKFIIIYYNNAIMRANNPRQKKNCQLLQQLSLSTESYYIAIYSKIWELVNFLRSQKTLAYSCIHLIMMPKIDSILCF